MTEEEKKILFELFPEADIGYDNDEQLVIYTGRFPDPYCEAEDWSDEPQKIVCKNNLEEKWKKSQ